MPSLCNSAEKFAGFVDTKADFSHQSARFLGWPAFCVCLFHVVLTTATKGMKDYGKWTNMPLPLTPVASFSRVERELWSGKAQ
jgi:hypothetical protein